MIGKEWKRKVTEREGMENEGMKREGKWPERGMER